MNPTQEWDNVWRQVQALTQEFPEDVVLIGGVAVYLHTQHAPQAGLPPEFTHDADVCVGLACLGDLRDRYEVVANRRLSKHQMILEGVEFDLYVERNNTLRVDYGALAMAAVEIGGVKAAHLEHLLLLKLDALAARWASSHGAKDRRDVAKVLVLLQHVEPQLFLAQAGAKDVDLLERVLDSDAFAALALGNAQKASKLKHAGSAFVQRTLAGMGGP